MVYQQRLDVLARKDPCVCEESLYVLRIWIHRLPRLGLLFGIAPCINVSSSRARTRRLLVRAFVVAHDMD